MARHFHLPKLKDPLCTVKYMEEVKAGSIVCFCIDDIKMHTCG